MAIKKIENNNGICSLEMEISGLEYDLAVYNYLELFSNTLKSRYIDYSFPEGKMPIEVVEKNLGDEVYKYVLKKLFPQALQEAIAEANIVVTKIDKVDIVSLSRKKAVCKVDLSIENLLETESDNVLDNKASTLNPDVAIEKAINSSNADYLEIIPTKKRNRKFWKNIEKNCDSWFDFARLMVLPLLCYQSKEDIGKTNPDVKNIMYQDLELFSFVYGVYFAALYRFIPSMSSKDLKNIKKHIYKRFSKTVSNKTNKESIKYNFYLKRLSDYSNVCKNGIACGYSTFGLDGIRNFRIITEKSANLEVKCALLLCDILKYIEKCDMPLDISELKKVKHYSVNNTESDIEKIEKIYIESYGISQQIFSEVRGALNGANRMEKRAKKS